MKRVAITGLGVIAPNGIGTRIFFNASVGGESGITKITSFDCSEYNSKIAGELKEYFPEQHFVKHELNHYGRASQYAIVATNEALNDSGLLETAHDKNKIGVCLGTTNGEVNIIESIDETWVKNGLDTVPLQMFRQYQSCVIANNVSRHFGFKGPSLMVPNACSAGNYSISLAYDRIKNGQATAMIAGGTDPLSQIAFAGFSRIFAVADDCCPPFDRNRKGNYSAAPNLPTSRPPSIPKLPAIFSRNSINLFGRLVDNRAIAADGYNIAVSSYMEQENTREAVDITALNAEISRIVTRQTELRTGIDAIMADLEGEQA